MALKHSYRMLLADRVRDDLVSAVRATNPTGDIAAAIDLIAKWDKTVAPDEPRRDAVRDLVAAIPRAGPARCRQRVRGAVEHRRADVDSARPSRSRRVPSTLSRGRSTR